MKLLCIQDLLPYRKLPDQFCLINIFVLSKVTEGIPPSWGAHEERSVIWEALTAAALITAGTDIAVLRHPRAVELLKTAINSEP